MKGKQASRGQIEKEFGEQQTTTEWRGQGRERRLDDRGASRHRREGAVHLRSVLERQ